MSAVEDELVAVIVVTRSRETGLYRASAMGGSAEESDHCSTGGVALGQVWERVRTKAPATERVRLGDGSVP